MIPYLVLFLAAFSRLVPHALQGHGLNITAVGGGLLFFGSRRSRPHALAAIALLALTDVYLTRFVYEYPFHVQSYLVTWAWYGAVCLMASSLLRRVTPLRVAAAVVSSATGFFLLSNLVVWLGAGLYAHSGAGLVACYVAALPFYANDLVSTSLTAGVLFGLPVVATMVVHMLRDASAGQTPVA